MKRLCLVLAALVVVSPAFAQTSMQQKLETRFAAADVNHDGKLTMAEAQAGMPLVARHFNEIDTAHAGYVTLDQIEQFAAQHGR
jgi:Ca2+-binding EF-hand superfamily protein